MKLEDKLIIWYEGIQDWSIIGQDNLVCYTSIKNKSTGLMTYKEFDKYKIIGYDKQRNKYICKRYK